MTGDPWGDESRWGDRAGDQPVEPGPPDTNAVPDSVVDDETEFSSVGAGSYADPGTGDDESGPGGSGLTETGSVGGPAAGSGAVGDDSVEPIPTGADSAPEPVADDAAELHSVGGGDDLSGPGELGLTETGSVTGPVGGSDVVEDDPVARIAGASSRIRAAARRAIEALVLVTEEPISVHLLGQLLEMSPAIVDDLCRELAAEYEDQGRGFQLVEVAGGWRYQSHPDLSPYVERFVLEGQTAKLSAAALETLAIVAYKQPISRAQVAAIRGVSVDGVMRTLQQRGYIAEIGKDPGPGQAVLFGTTRMFVEKLGLNDLSELPPLGDFVPGADVVEQLERGLRPDREPLRPEDAMGPNDGMSPGDSMSPEDDLGPNDPFGPEGATGLGNGAFGRDDASGPDDDLAPNGPFGPEGAMGPGDAFRPEDAMGPEGGLGPDDPFRPEGASGPEDDLGPDDPFRPDDAMGPDNDRGFRDNAFGREDATGAEDDLGPSGAFGPEAATGAGNATGATSPESVWGLTGRSADGEAGTERGSGPGGESGVEEG